MLVFLAAYPRSGTSLLTRIIGSAFWRLCAQVKVAPRPEAALPRVGGWEISRPDGQERIPVAGPLRDWLIRYRKEGSDEPARWGFRFVPQPLLTPAVRRRLAEDEETFLVKTHHPPFDSYHPGESVIQVVRHPGPVLRSYFRLLSAQAETAGAPAPTLEEVIEGRVQFGAWSAYHEAWAAARARLGPAALVLRYGELVERQAEARARIGAFLGLPVRSEQPVKFEVYARKQAPPLGVGGTDEGFEEYFSPGQLQRLERLHGEMAAALGLAPSPPAPTSQPGAR